MTSEENDSSVIRCCILAAGRGTRMGPSLDFTHKTLLPVGNKAIISHIIEKFPSNTHFVVVLGHLGHLVKDYLAIAHPHLNVTFVVVDNYQGPGAGPGYSLYAARSYLQSPFFITASDTIIKDELPNPPAAKQGNWMGVKSVLDPENWCTVSTDENGLVKGLHYKRRDGSALAFTGLARVQDYELFWQGLELDHSRHAGEMQVNSGFEAIIASGISAFPVSWIDTGTKENYLKALSEFPKNYTFTGKSTDITYRIGHLVVKYFRDPRTAEERFMRGEAHRDSFAQVKTYRGNFFSYLFEEGEPLAARRRKAQSAGSAAKEFAYFLEWLETRFWRASSPKAHEFSALLYNFYIKKTERRLMDFADRDINGYESELIIINDQPCPPVRERLANIKREILAGGLPSTFHGDLHDDNVLVSPASKFRLIDWRESFGGDLDCGDRYYDLAKILHTLTLSVEVMEQGRYWVKRNPERYPCSVAAGVSSAPLGRAVQIGNEMDSNTPECLRVFWDFVIERDYDPRRVELIHALVFVNMAPLYDGEMSEYLYLLGRHKLGLL